MTVDIKNAKDAPTTEVSLAPAPGLVPQGEPLLSVNNLHTWFELRKWGFGHAGYVQAVDGVSFNLYAGQAVAIVGESGCGKSTLMKTILGIHKPTRGDVIFEGKSISSFNHKEMQWYKSQIGYVQQDPFGALPPFMTIEKIMEEPLLINNVRDKSERLQRIRKVLNEVRLTPATDYLSKYPHMLSGGQQQRVVIARAMIMEPRIIVADEPVSMLDASVRVEILRLLQSLQKNHNLAIIYITHDLSTVRYFSERIFVMYAGKLVEKSEVDELLHSPLHPYTQALLAAIPDPDPANAHTLKELPSGEPPSLISPPHGCRFHPRCPRFMKGLCEVEEPPEFVPSPEHYTSCWLYNE